MKKVIYLAVEFTDEQDIVDNIVKAAMEAEDAYLDKDGQATARRGTIQIGKEAKDCIHFDIEIGESLDVNLVNLFPDEIMEEHAVTVFPEEDTSDEIPVFTGDAEVATAELAIA